MPIGGIAPLLNDIRAFQALRQPDIMQRLHDEFGIGRFELEDNGVFIGRGYRYHILHAHVSVAVGAGFRKSASEAVKPVVMKQDVFSGKFTAVGRRQLLPPNPLSKMNDVGCRVREFPAFCQVAFLVFGRVPGDLIIPDIGVGGPVVRHQPFQPGAVDIGQPLGEIGVEIDDIPARPDCDFPAVLRHPKFIPPVSGFLFHNAPCHMIAVIRLRRHFL